MVCGGERKLAKGGSKGKGGKRGGMIDDGE